MLDDNSHIDIITIVYEGIRWRITLPVSSDYQFFLEAIGLCRGGNAVPKFAKLDTIGDLVAEM